jgi:Arc/MetJ-type ribon-helix-helix transcriptional regulator
MVGTMARGTSNLAKKSLVVNERDLRAWVRLGGFRNESEAVRGAVAAAVAIRRMQDAIADLQRRGTFGRRLA